MTAHRSFRYYDLVMVAFVTVPVPELLRVNGTDTLVFETTVGVPTPATSDGSVT